MNTIGPLTAALQDFYDLWMIREEIKVYPSVICVVLSQHAYHVECYGYGDTVDSARQDALERLKIHTQDRIWALNYFIERINYVKENS